MTYQLEEAVLELPPEWTDRTLNVFAAGEGAGGMNISVSRHPPKGRSLDAVFHEHMIELSRALPRFEIEAERATTVGHLPAQAATIRWSAKGKPMVQELVYVAYYDTILIFTGSAPSGARDEASATFARILETVRFRKRA